MKWCMSQSSFRGSKGYFFLGGGYQLKTYFYYVYDKKRGIKMWSERYNLNIFNPRNQLNALPNNKSNVANINLS